MNTAVNKPLEHTFEFGLALTATLLQINMQQLFDWNAVALKLAILSGSITYVIKAKNDEKMSFREACFTALSGFTFGVYMAPFVVDLYAITKPASTTGVHYLSGAFGQWILNVGWAILKGAHKEGWSAIRDRFFPSRKKRHNSYDENEYPNQ